MQWKCYQKDVSQVGEYQPPALHSEIITFPLSAGGWEGVGSDAAPPAKQHPGRDDANCSFLLLHNRTRVVLQPYISQTGKTSTQSEKQRKFSLSGAVFADIGASAPAAQHWPSRNWCRQGLLQILQGCKKRILGMYQHLREHFISQLCKI